MKKQIMAVITAALMLTGLTGCGNFNNDNDLNGINSGIDDNYVRIETYENSVLPIYDANSQEIGSIDCYNYSALVNGSILYSKLPENASSEKTLEYRLYNIESKDDHLLTVIDDYSSEASYNAVRAGDHLYLSISLGEYGDLENMKQTIYDVDLLKRSMSPILKIEQAIPYNSYAIANNKLVLAELLHNGTTDLVEYDLNQKSFSPVVHAYDESDCFVSDSIRYIYADSENIYMVRLHHGESENYFLYLDKYDFDYNLIDTVDLRDFCVSTDRERTEDSRINEWKQFIASFFVHNDLIYYQNFSTTNAIGIMENDKVNRLFDINSLFYYANSLSENSENDLFVELSKNILYLVNSQTREVKTAEFFADNRDYNFSAALRDGDDILLLMGYVPYDKGERLPDRLYYIDLNDLDFKLMDY